MDFSELTERLLATDAYANAPESVTTLETHISVLFFAGDRVYKLKKPVDLGFLDFTTLAARKHFCEEEVRLNRRLAPSTYLGVVEIRLGPAGRPVIGGDGALLDYAVEMVRLPAHRMFDRLLDSGDIDNATMRNLAGILTRFHEQAATGPGVDEHGSLATVSANSIENFEQTRDFRGSLISHALHAFLESWTRAFLDQNAELLDSRVADHRIRDGHGDLHAGNICVLSPSPSDIVIYDCIEFSPRFRCGDVACDLAFLLMDLDLRCYRAFSDYLLRQYRELSKDSELDALIRFYKGYRAMVRGKVAAMRSAQAPDDPGVAREAMRYFQLAASYALPATLILTCGLPGSGKSFAARELARPFEALIVNSDTVRKRISGIPPSERHVEKFEGGIYTRERSQATYARLCELAREQLEAGKPVIVDAGFRSPEQRQPFLELARELTAPLVVLWVDPPDAVIRERLARRADDESEVSDAGLSVYLETRKSFVPPAELPSAQVVHIADEVPGETIAALVIDAVLGGDSTESTAPTSRA